MSRREAGTIIVQGQGWIEQKGSRDYSTRPGMD